MMTHLSKSKKNYIYNSLYQILLIIIPLITTPYISRILGAEKIGLYSYSHTIAYYFALFIMLGLNNYGNRSIAYVRDSKEKLSKTFSEIYQMQLLTSIIVIASYVIYTFLFSNTTITWIMLIYVVSSALDINWFFFGLEKFKLTAIRSSVIKIISTVCIFLLVKKADDVSTYALIYVISFLINQLVLWFYLKQFVKIERTPLINTIKHIKPNLVLFIPIIAVGLYRMMDKIMLGTISSLEQLGYYENSEKIISVPTALIVSLGTIMMPKISNYVKKNKQETIKTYIEKSIYYGIFMSSSLCMGIMALANDFVPWYFGPDFKPCIQLLYILMPSCLFYAITDIVRTQYLIPYKKEKIYVISVIVGALVNIIINALLIPKNGAIGAAIGTLLAETVVCIMQLIMTRKELKLGKILLKSSWYIVAGIIMLTSLVLIPNISNNATINIICKTIIGGVVFTVISFPIAYKQKLLNMRISNK